MTFPSNKFKEIVGRIEEGEDPIKSICEVYGYFDYDDMFKLTEQEEEESSARSLMIRKAVNEQIEETERKLRKFIEENSERKRLYEAAENFVDRYNKRKRLDPLGGYVFASKERYGYGYRFNSWEKKSMIHYGSSSLQLEELLEQLEKTSLPVIFSYKFEDEEKGNIKSVNYENVSIRVNIERKSDFKKGIKGLLADIPEGYKITGLDVHEATEGVDIIALYKPIEKYQNGLGKSKIQRGGVNYVPLNPKPKEIRPKPPNIKYLKESSVRGNIKQGPNTPRPDIRPPPQNTR